MPDLYLLGSGVLSFMDITLYTQRALKQCAQVFYLHDMPTLDGYLAEVAPSALNLMPRYYIDGRDRHDIYEDITNHVIDALRTGPLPVGLLLHGHPLVYSSISQRMIAKTRAAGFAIEIVPGVSSLDRMFVDLELDIGNRGVQVLHATVAIVEGIPINPTLDCFLFQLGALLNDRASRGESLAPAAATPLVDYLLQFYPPTHVVTIVESAVELGYETRKTSIAIAELADAAEAMNYTCSMFVPAIV